MWAYKQSHNIAMEEKNSNKNRNRVEKRRKQQIQQPKMNSNVIKSKTLDSFVEWTASELNEWKKNTKR